MNKTLCKKSKITVLPVGVCDTYEVGNWTDCYPSVKLGYKNDNHLSQLSDTSFYVKDQDKILGYFMVYNIVNLQPNAAVPLYSKKLVLYDFAVSARAYAKYGLILLNFLITYAQNNGYAAIEIQQSSKYGFFFGFLARHFKPLQLDNAYYILIDAPKQKAADKHLVVYDGDKVQLDDLYFLRDLGFSVGKTFAKLKLTDTQCISVDRSSGAIHFPSNVQIVSDAVTLNAHTRNVVHLLCQMYNTNSVTAVQVDYSVANPTLFEVYADSTLYVNKSISALADDVNYVQCMIDKGVQRITPYVINYDMNSRTFSYNCGGVTCDKLLKMHSSRLKSKLGKV